VERLTLRASVREHGVSQFLHLWQQVKNRTNDVLLWGDEIEYHIFAVQDNRVVVANIAAQLLEKLNHEDAALPEAERHVTWHPEFGAWMLEATPSRPYGGFTDDLLKVEPNMRVRRYRAIKALQEMLPGASLVSTVAWPLLGTKDFWTPRKPGEQPEDAASQSLFIPDSCINPHPRFPTLTANIRRRRGSKVDIRVPLLKDVRTDDKQSDIYMDAMGFGMGCCCLQVTFQARDLDESRHLYDQLAVLCPIFLALTAGTPAFKGLLADTDVRWSAISQSVDCRTSEERGLPSVSTQKHSHGPIRKSRYDSVDVYMGTHPSFQDKYNDVNTEVDQRSFERLLAGGVDERLARHVAHLFVRDPLVIFSDRVEVDDAVSTEHFENLQSTNWQTMRWKPPPPNAPMGWRVEFRPMEVQFTDFENAAFTVVVALCARVILFFDLVFYVPLSKVDENMRRAHARDAVLSQKFFFRKHLVPLEAQCGPTGQPVDKGDADAFEEMPIEDILMGRGDHFPGLVPLIWGYLDVIGVDGDTRAVIDDYIDLVVRRAKGELPTPARWMRDFYTKHPDYKQDSVVTETMAKDLIEKICAIATGVQPAPELLGRHVIAELSEALSVSRAQAKISKPPPRALRGSSFHNDVGTTQQSTFQCAIVRALVEKYRTVSPRLKESVLADGKGFRDSVALFKRTKVA